MKPDEPFTPDDFEASLRGLHPSSTTVDATEVFYQAGLQAGARERSAFDKAECFRMLSVALLTGLVVGSLAYRTGISTVAMPDAPEIATSPHSDGPIETKTNSVHSLAEVGPDGSTRLTWEGVNSPLDRYPFYAAVPDRLSIPYTPDLPRSADVYRLPRRSVPHVKNRTMLTVRSVDMIEQLLGELQ